MVYTRSDESQALGVEIPVVTLGNILPRVFVASVPSGLGTRERAREAVASGLEIEDGVDSVAAATHADHDCVLIRAHDVGDVVKHRFPLKGFR